MAELSDISSAVENMQIYFFYAIGSASLVVETTLFIIATKGSALTPEFKFLTIFQQIACLLSTAFLTLLFIPFFYPRLGGGYCMGLLCLLIPYEYMLVVQVFLTATKFAAFGMMIIARHQVLLMDDSCLKVKPAVRYAVYILLLIILHGVTITAMMSALVSDREKQIYSLRWHPQITWRERGLNWFLFDGLSSPWLMNIAFYSNMLLLPAIFALIVLPFTHMFRIVSEARKRVQPLLQQKAVHIQQARTIIIQCFVLLAFFLFPFIAPAISTMRNNVYADTQTLVVLSEMVFVCSTLCNSIVIVARNRVYRSAISKMLGTMPFLMRQTTSKSEQPTDSVTRN